MTELLTPEERDLVTKLGQCWGDFSKILGKSDTRHADAAEFVAKIHDLQNTVLSQAAARAYPDTYRLAGETFDKKCRTL